MWQDLCDVLQHPESLTQALERVHSGHWLPQELQARRENLSQARKRMVNQLERLTEAYLNEVIPLAEYQRRRKEIEKKQEGLQNQEKLLDTQVEQRTHLSQLSASIETFCEKVRDGVEQATFEQKRQLVELLIDRVIVTNDKVEIRYVIPTTPESENVRFCHLRSDYRHHLYSDR